MLEEVVVLEERVEHGPVEITRLRGVGRGGLKDVRAKVLGWHGVVRGKEFTGFEDPRRIGRDLVARLGVYERAVEARREDAQVVVGDGGEGVAHLLGVAAGHHGELPVLIVVVQCLFQELIQQPHEMGAGVRRRIVGRQTAVGSAGAAETGAPAARRPDADGARDELLHLKGIRLLYTPTVLEGEQWRVPQGIYDGRLGLVGELGQAVE